VPPQKTILQTPNHRSIHASTDFCNKIGTKLPIRDVRSSVATGGKSDMVQVTQIGSA
jgi:hypothetical protein